MIFSPLDQFEIKPLFTINNILTLSITNYVIYIGLVVLIIYMYNIILNKAHLG
ncbi:hypothetical protein GCM10010222_81730 [Streptomyces tanashiensis]|nr:hypothetical protein GCM10010187_75320 [Actinomadura coerulea]GGT27903.1 hypothetical protein GCM10010222_81730 [Streptomyces tanashiensis]